MICVLHSHEAMTPDNLLQAIAGVNMEPCLTPSWDDLCWLSWSDMYMTWHPVPPGWKVIPAGNAATAIVARQLPNKKSACILHYFFLQKLRTDIFNFIWFHIVAILYTVHVDNLAAILQTIFSDAFLWMKSFVFWLKFHWSLFLNVQLTINHHWLR